MLFDIIFEDALLINASLEDRREIHQLECV